MSIIECLFAGFIEFESATSRRRRVPTPRSGAVGIAPMGERRHKYVGVQSDNQRRLQPAG
jgi:hypothetical protein